MSDFQGLPSLQVATSIAPFNLDRQVFCVDSWQRSGLSVLSVNVPEEIELLRPLFPRVKFVPANRSALALAGRPFVFFDDVMAALFQSGSMLCGIINSDIEIPDLSAFRKEVAHAQEGLLFACRTDVATQGCYVGEDFRGFDVFFFHRDVTQMYPPSNFALGVPWWDWWCPLVPRLKGVPTRLGPSGMAFHLVHKANWSLDLYKKFGLEFVAQLRSPDAIALPTERIRRPGAPPEFSAMKYLSYVLPAVAWLLTHQDLCKRSSRRLLAASQDSRPLCDLELTQALLDFLDGSDFDVSTRVSEQELELLHELERIKNSVSWRYTQPFRDAKRILAWLKPLLRSKKRSRVV